jgi:hypothetical protein
MGPCNYGWAWISGSSTGCLSPTDMQCYTDNALETAWHEIDDHFPGYCPISYRMSEGIWPSNYYYHGVTFWIGECSDYQAP